jgi:hypothetical protein
VVLRIMTFFQKVPKGETNEKWLKDTLRELLAGYVVTADAASVLFTGEIAEMYPEAKVICMTRDQEAWYKSYEGVAQTAGSIWTNIITFILPKNRRYVFFMLGIVQRSVTSLGGNSGFQLLICWIRKRLIYPKDMEDPLVVGPGK